MHTIRESFAVWCLVATLYSGLYHGTCEAQAGSAARRATDVEVSEVIQQHRAFAEMRRERDAGKASTELRVLMLASSASKRAFGCSIVAVSGALRSIVLASVDESARTSITVADTLASKRVWDAAMAPLMMPIMEDVTAMPSRLPEQHDAVLIIAIHIPDAPWRGYAVSPELEHPAAQRALQLLLACQDLRRPAGSGDAS